jgi:hypothetical protein
MDLSLVPRIMSLRFCACDGRIKTDVDGRAV